MIPDRRGASWRQKIRRIAAGLRAGMVPPAAAAISRTGDTDAVSWIGPGVLAERLESGPAPVIVDVRGADEFNGNLGHLADALNIALIELPGRIGEFTQYKDRDLVLVCHTQMRWPRRRGCSIRRASTKSRCMHGGMVEWRRRGLPVIGGGSASAA